MISCLQLIIFALQLKRTANLHRELRNELLKLTTLTTCDKISEKSPPVVEGALRTVTRFNYKFSATVYVVVLKVTFTFFL
jgi:hypothetical protein